MHALGLITQGQRQSVLKRMTQQAGRHDCLLSPWTVRSVARAWRKLVMAIAIWQCAISVGLAMDENPVAIIVSAQAMLAPDLHADDLSLIFWRKKLYATHGQPLRPVNLYSEHPLRLRFSQHILRSAPKSQVNYWNGLYFHGVQPPFTVQSEEAMIRYVAETDGAVGYIDACHLDERVKPVFWLLAGRLTNETPSLHCELNERP